MGHGIDALHRLNVTFVLHGQNCINSFWFRSKPNTISNNFQQDCDAIVSDWFGVVWPKYQAFCSQEVKLIGMVAVTLSHPNLAQTVSTPINQFGSVAGDALPSHDAAVLSLYTHAPGRRTHGRLYIPGVPEVNQAGGNLNAVSQANLALLGDVLRTQFGIDGISQRYWLCVYSRKNGNGITETLPRAVTYNPLAGIPIKRTVANERIGTCRKRKLGRGI